MNKYLLETMELIKTDEEIKKDIEELRFWCIVLWYMQDIWYNCNWGNWWGWCWWENIYRYMRYFREECFWKVNKTIYSIVEDEKWKGFLYDTDYYEWIEEEDWEYCVQVDKIIWQIELRHLMWFIENKQKNIVWWEFMKIYDTGEIVFFNDSDIILVLDNKKPFMEQDEEFYKKLKEFLISEFNIDEV